MGIRVYHTSNEIPYFLWFLLSHSAIWNPTIPISYGSIPLKSTFFLVKSHSIITIFPWLPPIFHAHLPHLPRNPGSQPHSPGGAPSVGRIALPSPSGRRPWDDFTHFTGLFTGKSWEKGGDFTPKKAETSFRFLDLSKEKGRRFLLDQNIVMFIKIYQWLFSNLVI